jgi:hypothetical protein
MHTPDAKSAANTLAPAPATMSVQQLMDSLKPEAPLVIESGTGGFGTGGAGAASTTTTTPSPVTTAPQ